MKNKHNKNSSRIIDGFTIVELLVVIVIIGILASITIVSYNGVASRAKVAAIKSDLVNNAKKIQLYYAEYGTYPTAFNGKCPSAPTADTKYCLQSNSTVSYTGGATNFALSLTDDANNAYQITEKGTAALACPTGFIIVPGSSTYNTTDFCVMKYEAKDGGGIAASLPQGSPVTNVDHPTAVTESTRVCTGCHLISEAEWMTIAQNVLSVASNWSGGAVGNGYIYRGNSDGGTNYPLPASANDSDGYYETGNNSGSGPQQKRTLTLSNGEIIWDFAGNAWEWTSYMTDGVTAHQAGMPSDSVGIGGYAIREWTALTTVGTLPVNQSPSGTGLSGSTAWNSSYGIGTVDSNANGTEQISFFRGGYYDSDNQQAKSGVLSLDLYTPDFKQSHLGFRVAK